ncbi:MAG TPA: MFS transporter [Bacilli bacterium]|nr:MFS transporter [Bacilli bacterium]
MSRLITYRQLFMNWRFMSLWSGSLLSGIGDAVITVSLVWMIYQQTGSPFLLSLTLICLEFPKFLASPIFGVYLDRYPAIFFALLSNSISGILFVFLAFVPLESGMSYVWFMLLIALSSSLSPVTKAATSIIIKETVDEEKLISANSLMNIQFDLALTLGPVVGGILMALGQMEAACLLNAGTFFIGGILYYLAMPPHARRRKRAVIGEKSVSNRFTNWRSELASGIRFILKSKVIRAVVVANCMWNFLIWGTSSALLPIFSDHYLSAEANGYGILIATLSVGIVIGSFVTGAVKVENFSLKKFVFLSIAAHGLAYSLLSVSSGILGAVAILLLCGIVSAPAMIYIRTLLQVSVPREMMGRVITVSSAFVGLGYPVGTTLAAGTVTTIGQGNVAWLFAIFGGAIVLLTLWLLVTAVERVKKAQVHSPIKKNRTTRLIGMVPNKLVNKVMVVTIQSSDQIQMYERITSE